MDWTSCWEALKWAAGGAVALISVAPAVWEFYGFCRWRREKREEKEIDRKVARALATKLASVDGDKERSKLETELAAERKARKEAEAAVAAERRARKNAEAAANAMRKKRWFATALARAFAWAFALSSGWARTRTAGKRKTLTVQGVEYAFRYCPPGTFRMGSPTCEQGRCDDETLHKVTLTRGFWLLETPVTQRMWEALAGGNPSWFSATGGGAQYVAETDASLFPVENVNLSECLAFIKRLNDGGFAPKGFEFRLPTEAEWEYACRAGTETPYFWGATLKGERANCNGALPCGTSEKGPSLGRTTAVGSYAANPWGLFDMHGNVWEWCSDRSGAYSAAPQTDPTGTPDGWFQIVRGGCWDCDAARCRAAYRGTSAASYSSGNRGFRLALSCKREKESGEPSTSAN